MRVSPQVLFQLMLIYKIPAHKDNAVVNKIVETKMFPIRNI